MSWDTIKVIYLPVCVCVCVQAHTYLPHILCSNFSKHPPLFLFFQNIKCNFKNMYYLPPLHFSLIVRERSCAFKDGVFFLAAALLVIPVIWNYFNIDFRDVVWAISESHSPQKLVESKCSYVPFNLLRTSKSIFSHLFAPKPDLRSIFLLFLIFPYPLFRALPRFPLSLLCFCSLRHILGI